MLSPTPVTRHRDDVPRDRDDCAAVVGARQVMTATLAVVVALAARCFEFGDLQVEYNRDLARGVSGALNLLRLL